MRTSSYHKVENEFDSLSFHDLLAARDLYHAHLLNYPNVVSTAIGRYRIRSKDSWPKPDGTVEHAGTGRRTLGNSEVRPYSWPAILVFVDNWASATSFRKGKHYDPSQMVPPTLFLPNGIKVPVCVIEIEKDFEMSPTPVIQFPLNNIGGGNPVIADIQRREHVATVSCLVSDGHRTYALTNRHVVGDPGEVLYSRLNGRKELIGRSSGRQVTRLPFEQVYHDCPGKDVYLNLDAGLIDIDDLGIWTAQVHEIGTLGQLADLVPSQMKLSLVGRRVVGVGAASGRMEGEITALLYRYKSVGGFEYLADFLIGPRGGRELRGTDAWDHSQPTLLTRPGDSGALWCFDPVDPNQESHKREKNAPLEYHPFGVQWGAQVFDDGKATSFALAASLSTICSILDLDLVRDWNLDQTPTWGSIGHFSIATSAVACLTNKRLKNLMAQNASIVSPCKDDIESSNFKGMGSSDFVPLADVPDMFWKLPVAKQGFARPMEGPNHFADMDQKRCDGKSLLDLTEDPDFIDPVKWNEFYSSVKDILSGDTIKTKHRGLLPFRVWQIFDDMVEFVKGKKVPEFVCAAGVLTHYIGDACQPLHISYFHDGDPTRPQIIHSDGGLGKEKVEALGSGVHSAYENGMIGGHRGEILDRLTEVEPVKENELITTGFDAAKKTIKMMRMVFKQLPPCAIVDFYIKSDAKPKQLSDEMWKEFGEGTVTCMQEGVHLVSVLWQSAWLAGNGDQNVKPKDLKALKPEAAMKFCQDKEFLLSTSIDKIGDIIQKPN